MGFTPESSFEEITAPLAAEMLTYDATVPTDRTEQFKEMLLARGYSEDDIMTMLGFEEASDEV